MTIGVINNPDGSRKISDELIEYGWMWLVEKGWCTSPKEKDEIIALIEAEYPGGLNQLAFDWAMS